MQTQRDRQRSLNMLMIVQLLFGFRGGIIAPILSLFIRDQGFTMAQVGILGTASMLGWFIFEPLMGLIADKWNKRLMLAGSLLFTTVLFGLYPIVKGVWVFIAMEFAKTSIMSAYSIPMKALTAELLPTEDRGRAYGRYMTVISFGSMISPLIGGYITEKAGYSMPFYLAAGIGLIGIIAALRIQYDESSEQTQVDNGKNIKKLLTGSVLAIFSVRGIFFVNSGFTGSFLSIYLNESPRYIATESQIGAFYTVQRLMGVLSRSILGNLCDKLGNRKLIMGSLLGLGISYVLLVNGSGLWILYGIAILYGLSEAATETSMMLHLISVIPEGRRGLTMGLYSEAENIGGLLSTPTIGYLYENFGGDYSVMLVAAVLLLDAVYSFFVIKEKPREA